MTEGMLEQLGTNIDDAFFLFAAAVFGFELLEAFFKRSFTGKKLGEMLVSASTQIPYLLIEVFLMTGAYGLYYIISESWVSWQFEITWVTIVAAVIVADFTYYWEHRIAHEVRILWTQHAVHHSSRDYNIITALRFGPLESLWSFAAHIPMILIGFPAELVFFGTLMVLGYQTWLHTESIGRLGPLEWVMNTPSHHRVHHGSDDKYLDRNYAGILIIWDRMFGTFQVEEETPRYGLKRDFDSRNPIHVWFSEIPGLWHDLKHARSPYEVFMRLFGRPDWKP